MHQPQAVSGASGTNMSIYINTDNGVTFNGVSSVTTADVVASNGIVHIVDSVIAVSYTHLTLPTTPYV